MHCPRCGQQQVSEETRFCSRCGFPLALVSQILFHGGILPQLTNLEQSGQKKKLLTRHNGIKFGLAWFLVMTFLLTPLAAIANADGLAPAFAVLGFMGGIIMMIVSLLFLEKEPKFQPSELYHQPIQPVQSNYLNGNPNAPNALPPPQSQPAQQDFMPPVGQGSWKAPDTGELTPHSVTEGTTKLLQKDE